MTEPDMPLRLLVATRNSGKCREIRALLDDMPVAVMTLDSFPDAPHVEEDGDTLEENAARKACGTARACGIHTMADDSGLFVDALGGRPGVHSARYAGPGGTSGDLCTKLLAEMADTPEGSRGAHFRCWITLSDPAGRIVLTAEGRVEGRIGHEMRGAGGFGYDPVFVYGPAGCTFAEMRPDAKNAVSHRGRALARFRSLLTDYLAGGNCG
jgi:XTP/dITP diphosphohydrolase